MTTDVQRHRQPKLRLPRRPYDDSTAVIQTMDADAGGAMTLAEFARRHPLPSVVRVVHGRFADIGCGSDDADAEIYVHSMSSAAGTSDKKTTVFAQVMRFADDAEFSKHQSTWRSPHRQGNRGTATSARRLVATGRTVCLPDDGIEVAGCWFELLSEDGRAAPPVTSVEELTNRALRRVPQVGGGVASGDGRAMTRYLVRQTVFASVGSVSSATLAIQPGETLMPLRVIASAGAAPDLGTQHRLRRIDRHLLNLQCVDSRHRMVFLPLDQQGLFSPIVESNENFPDPTPPLNGIGVVYDGIKSIIASCRLPVTVRIAAGRLSIPDSAGVSSGSTAPIFRLTGVSEPDSDRHLGRHHAASSSKTTQHNADDSRAIYVMSLRHAWSFDASVHASTGAMPSDVAADDDDEWRRRLTAVPLSAARSLEVVAASRDFHISWLTTEDGRELARRCDRLIARHHSAAAAGSSGSRKGRHKSTTSAAATKIDDGNEDDYEFHADRRDHHTRNTPRRQTSIDSGLASSALNDDLYDEIDHIYCMIRYGPDARPIIVEPPPEANRRQRLKSHDNAAVGGGGAFHAGCRLEVGIGGYVPRGVAAVLNDRRSPELGHRMNGGDRIGWSHTARQPRDNVTAQRQITAQTVTANSRFRTHNTHKEPFKQQQQQQHRPSSRPPSRCAGDVSASPMNAESRRTECDGRSETGRISRKSSVAVIALDDEDVDVLRDQFDNRDGRMSTDGIGFLSPQTIVCPVTGGGVSDRESGNATAADVTTTSDESPALLQKYGGRRQSAHDAVAAVAAAVPIEATNCSSANAADESTKRSPGRGRRSLSASGTRTRKEPAGMTDDRYSRTDVNETPSSATSNPQNEIGGGGGGGRQNRKSAFVAVISQSLANALRRVGKRSNGMATFGGGSGSAEAVSEAAHDVPTMKMTGTERSRKKRNESKNCRKGRKSTWYHSDAAVAAAIADDNNNSSSNIVVDDDDDLEVFDYDIGDGRPNIDFRRDFYTTARSRQSWAVGTVTTAFDTAMAESSTRPRRKTSDPPLLLSPRGGGGGGVSGVDNGQTKRSKSPTRLFDGYRGLRTTASRNNDIGAYIGGQYKNIGQY